MFSVEWEQGDIEELNLDLQALMPEELAGKELPRWSLELEQDVMGYPPEKVGSTYVRTLNLFGGWKREVQPKQVRIFNPVEYGIFVQGREQTAMHAGTGWKNLFEKAAEHLDRLLYRLEMKAARIWSD